MLDTATKEKDADYQGLGMLMRAQRDPGATQPFTVREGAPDQPRTGESKTAVSPTVPGYAPRQGLPPRAVKEAAAKKKEQDREQPQEAVPERDIEQVYMPVDEPDQRPLERDMHVVDMPVDEPDQRPPERNIVTHQGLWRTRANVGNWTGAIRPHYPRIRRPFGVNPRELFLGKRYTGMYATGYDASIVESKATPSFIPPQRKMVQDGAPTITDYIPALRSGGSEHVLFGTNHRR